MPQAYAALLVEETKDVEMDNQAYLRIGNQGDLFKQVGRLPRILCADFLSGVVIHAKSVVTLAWRKKRRVTDVRRLSCGSDQGYGGGQPRCLRIGK